MVVHETQDLDNRHEGTLQSEHLQYMGTSNARVKAWLGLAPTSTPRKLSLSFFYASPAKSAKAQDYAHLTLDTKITNHTHTHTYITMAKDRSEKKEKKEKRKSVDGVKKEKKSRRSSVSSDAAAALADKVDDTVDADGDVNVDADESGAAASVPLGALVPFANPLCDDKVGKKVLKSVKKGMSPCSVPVFILIVYRPLKTADGCFSPITAAKQKCLKRGVKEVVKAVRKTPAGNPTTPASALPSGIVVLAADISPMDVISHIPVLCEDHNIPYVFLTSRAELGAAGSTKRPTSVVMVTPKAGGKPKDGESVDEDWDEAYKELNKLVQKQGQNVKV